VKIFSGVAFNNHYDTIRDAVIAVVRRAQSLTLLDTPWSLVELLADPEDFNWLCQWAHALSPAVASQCLNNGQWKRFDTDIGECSHATGIGVLLLMFAVEVARRSASERSLWFAISNSHFSAATQKVLFTQNYPVRAYKDTIELAVRWLRLRHVFGIEGLQNWYDTVSLQLGFTKLGFSRRLPEWLVSQNSTFAIQHLLDGPMRSKTFSELWYALGQFRRKNMAEEQLRRILQHNPWILPEWLPELLQQATARIQQLGYAPSSSTAALDESAEEFLEQPRLVWDPGVEPVFTCRIMNLSLFDLTEPTYIIMVADHICGSLQRHIDGLYVANPPDEIRLPLLSPLLVASLLAPDGRIVQNQTLQLWDQGEDVSAFTSPAGRYLDPWKKIMQTKESYYLVLASDLEIQPQPVHRYNLNAHARLYLLTKEWSADTQILLEGSVLWQPKLSSVAVPVEQLDKDALQIHSYDTPARLAFGSSIRFKISYPKNYTITFIRSAGQSIGFDQQTTTSTVTKPIVLQPHMVSSKTNTCLNIMLGIQHTSTLVLTRLRYTIEVPLVGVAVLDKDSWTALDTNQPLNIEQAKRQLMRFYLMDTEDWPLLEGDTWIDSTWRRPRSLHACAGFGSVLKIQKSAYNASALDQTQQIVCAVINTGCVQTITLKDEQNVSSRVLHIQLTRSIEPDMSHSIVWWDQDGTYVLFKPERWLIRDSIMCWSATLPTACGQPLAIGVAYEGHWLGTWYSRNWIQILSATYVEASRIVTLIRWFHLPLMSQDIFPSVEHFACTHALETVPIWLAEDCSLPGLQFARSDDSWISVVRKIFFNWQPESNIGQLVQRLIDPLLANDPLTVSQQIVSTLSRVSPILMAKTLRAWVETVCIPQGGRQDSLVLIKRLLYEMAGADDKGSLVKRKRHLLQELVDNGNGERREMDVDENFIKKVLLARAISALQGQDIEPIDRENIAIAMRVEPFRRLQSIYLLEQIYNQLSRR
jgi:hypothetical protein